MSAQFFFCCSFLVSSHLASRSRAHSRQKPQPACVSLLPQEMQPLSSNIVPQTTAVRKSSGDCMKNGSGADFGVSMGRESST